MSFSGSGGGVDGWRCGCCKGTGLLVRKLLNHPVVTFPARPLESGQTLPHFFIHSPFRGFDGHDVALSSMVCPASLFFCPIFSIFHFFLWFLHLVPLFSPSVAEIPFAFIKLFASLGRLFYILFWLFNQSHTWQPPSLVFLI